MKSTQKTFAKIKRTLQTYAIARPTTRLSIKILKSPSDNGNWTYGPSSNAGMAEAALQVVGRDVAGQFVEMSWPSTDNSSIMEGNSSQSTVSESQQDRAAYVIDALLPSLESSE